MDESTIVQSDNDGFIAIMMLVVTAVIVVVVFIYLRQKKVIGSDSSGRQGGAFTPPPGRAKFLEARNTLDPSNINDLDKLKKLLMRRTLENIPNLIALQSEGNAIDRLYKRGMLTDDVHFRIQEMKTFFDEEFRQVQQDADELVPGWAQSIWPQAMQYYKMLEDKDNKVEESVGGAARPTASNTPTEATSPKKPTVASAVAPTAAPAAASKPVIPVNGPDALARKQQEADRMAQQLLEEEAQAASKSKGGSGSASKKNKKK